MTALWAAAQVADITEETQASIDELSGEERANLATIQAGQPDGVAGEALACCPARNRAWQSRAAIIHRIRGIRPAGPCCSS